jgi:hypothetical protein
MPSKPLLNASTVAMLTGKISNLHKDDLLDPSPFDHLFPKLVATGATPPRYFARYDAASPKDSPLNAPLTSPSAVVDQLVTSQWSHSSLSDALALDSPIHIYFMPWDEMMDTRREYRVFCVWAIYGTYSVQKLFAYNFRLKTGFSITSLNRTTRKITSWIVEPSCQSACTLLVCK